jgi:hypothetical protein
MLIFLDFDGVLRREDAPRYRFEKPLRVAFEAAVRRIPDAQIVVTSTWREVVGLTGLRKLFSADVAERIVGVTPFALVRDDYYRYREILAYLKQNGAEGRQWVAVDDTPAHYPRGVPLILVDPARGLGPAEAEKLVGMARA